jgi:hypothetical protein
MSQCSHSPCFVSSSRSVRVDESRAARRSDMYTMASANAGCLKSRAACVIAGRNAAVASLTKADCSDRPPSPQPRGMADRRTTRPLDWCR